MTYISDNCAARSLSVRVSAANIAYCPRRSASTRMRSITSSLKNIVAKRYWRIYAWPASNVIGRKAAILVRLTLKLAKLLCYTTHASKYGRNISAWMERVSFRFHQRDMSQSLY